MSPRWSAGVLEDGRVDWPRALLIALTVAVVVALAVTASTSTTAFDPYNAGWDGATDLRQQIEDDADVESELVLDSSQYATLEANEFGPGRSRHPEYCLS